MKTLQPLHRDQLPAEFDQYLQAGVFSAAEFHAARIIAEAHRVAPHHGVARVDFALTLVGNRGLERVLMTYLEDLTILKSELEDGPISQR